jgi:hypothetical protein
VLGERGVLDRGLGQQLEERRDVLASLG